jgi:hypothetical protein
VSCLVRVEPCGVVGEAAWERPFRLIAEVALRRRAVEGPLEVELGDRPWSDLEAPGREHWPDEGGHVAELPILATRNVVGERREWSRRDERPFSDECHVSDVDEVEAVIASLC